MAKVTGVGGVFYKVEDPEATKRWYQEISGSAGNGARASSMRTTRAAIRCCRRSRRRPTISRRASKGFMINLRVDDLDAMVAELESKGIEILGRQSEEYGKFAWILDCDGIKIELCRADRRRTGVIASSPGRGGTRPSATSACASPRRRRT